MEQNEQTTEPTAQPGPETPPTDATPNTGEHPVDMTSKAVQMVKLTRQEEGMDDSFGLRVAVVGGGCSGFQYALDFTDEARDNDLVYEIEGPTVYVDALSARYLQGTRIDYVMGMAGAGFKFENPKAVGSCGCGSSFAV